jgi:hypothetical protein
MGTHGGTGARDDSGSEAMLGPSLSRNQNGTSSSPGRLGQLVDRGGVQADVQVEIAPLPRPHAEVVDGRGSCPRRRPSTTPLCVGVGAARQCMRNLDCEPSGSRSGIVAVSYRMRQRSFR